MSNLLKSKHRSIHMGTWFVVILVCGTCAQRALWAGEKDPCAPTQGRDCNEDGILDVCEIFLGLSADCDRNTIPDSCDVLTPRSTTPQPLSPTALSDDGDESTVDVVTRGDLWVAVWVTDGTLGGTIGDDPDIVVSRSFNGGATWTAAVPLNTNAVTDNALEKNIDIGAHLSSDGQGTLLAVWYTNRLLGGLDDDDWDLVFARSIDDGANWSDPQPLHSNALVDFGADWSPFGAADGLGNWIVAWYTNEPIGEPDFGSDRDIFYVRSTDNGQTWTDATAIHSNAIDDSGWDSSPHIATDNGTWIVSWYTDDPLDTVALDLGDDRDIVMVRSTDAGETWSDPRPVNANADVDLGDDLVENIVPDGTGQWLAVWYSTNDTSGIFGTDHDIMIARSLDDGQTWEPPEVLNSHAVFDETWDSLPKIATGGDGYWVCVWQSEDSVGGTYGNDVDVLFAVSEDDGFTWTATEAVNSTAPDDGEFFDFGPTLVVDDVGRWKVFWLSENPMARSGEDEDLFFTALFPEDCNANDIPDSCDIADGSPDCGPNGIPDECEPDCNNNGVADSCDVGDGSSDDCNRDTIPDECQDTSADCNDNGMWDPCDVAFGRSADCNGNLNPDECDLDARISPDCNANSVPDECDVVQADSADCNVNVVPDECEVGGTLDCNENDETDLCDIFTAASGDCNTNAIPDECDIAAGVSDDCAGEGVPDECEPDCNANQVPDSCDIFFEDSEDCDQDTVPDDCQDTSADCNESGLWDPCDIFAGDSEDCDFNLVPDECQDTSADCNKTGLWDPCDIAAGESVDCNTNLVPDECDAVAPSIRMFIAPDGDEFDVQRFCETTVDMKPGSSNELAFWLEDNIQLSQITGIQPMLEMRARPLPGAVGSIEYINVAFMGCSEPPEDFGTPCDPQDDEACDGAPEFCLIMDGNSVFTDEQREDYVFFGDPTAGPAYHETPQAVQDEFGVAVFGILALRIPLDQGIFIDGTFYMGGFAVEVSADASGIFEYHFNSVTTDPPTPLNTLFGRSGVPYELIELQPLTIVIGDLQIVDSQPAGGAIDARRPSSLDGKELFGWDGVIAGFDRTVEAVSPDEFEILTSGGAAPQVVSAEPNGENVVLQFDRRIPPGECTTIRHIPSDSSISLGFLPGDVSGDGQSAPLDILMLVDELNGILDPPAQEWQSDIDRSGATTPLDILTLIDLLNGAGAYDPWNGAELPACP